MVLDVKSIGDSELSFLYTDVASLDASVDLSSIITSSSEVQFYNDAMLLGSDHSLALPLALNAFA